VGRAQAVHPDRSAASLSRSLTTPACRARARRRRQKPDTKLSRSLTTPACRARARRRRQKPDTKLTLPRSGSHVSSGTCLHLAFEATAEDVPAEALRVRLRAAVRTISWMSAIERASDGRWIAPTSSRTCSETRKRRQECLGYRSGCWTGQVAAYERLQLLLDPQLPARIKAMLEHRVGRRLPLTRQLCRLNLRDPGAHR